MTFIIIEMIAFNLDMQKHNPVVYYDGIEFSPYEVIQFFLSWASLSDTK